MERRESALRTLSDAGHVQTASQLADSAELGGSLPVHEAFAGLLTGLRRGTTVQVDGIGATSILLALAVAPSQEGIWAAAVGIPPAGLLAACEIGVALERLVVVPDPKDQWAEVLAAVTDAFDLILAGPAGRAPSAAQARKLASRVRERRSVLVVLGDWPAGPDVRLTGTAARWHGIGEGHGRLQARELDLALSGRGSASRRRRATVWLPSPEGRVVAADPFTSRRTAPAVVALGGR